MDQLPQEMLREILSFERRPESLSGVNRQLSTLTQRDRNIISLLNREFPGWNGRNLRLQKYYLNRLALNTKSRPQLWDVIMKILEYNQEKELHVYALRIFHLFGRDDLALRFMRLSPDILQPDMYGDIRVFDPAQLYYMSLTGDTRWRDFFIEMKEEGESAIYDKYMYWIYEMVGFMTPEMREFFSQDVDVITTLEDEESDDSEVLLDILLNRREYRGQTFDQVMGDALTSEYNDSFDEEEAVFDFLDTPVATIDAIRIMQDLLREIPSIELSSSSNLIFVRLFPDHWSIDLKAETGDEALERAKRDSKTPANLSALLNQ